MQNITLRPYQERAATAAIEAIKRGIRRPVICAATGTGKSVIIARVIQRMLSANPKIRVCVATHVAELLTQNASKLFSMMPMVSAGYYSAELGKRDTECQVIFGGIQSLYRAKEDLGKFEVLIIDEAHTMSRKDKSMWHGFLDRLKEKYPNLIIIGFSATPFRMDSGSLTSGDDAMFDEIVFDYGLKMAVNDGYLCRLVGKKTATKFDISGVSKLAGEYNLKQLEEATNLDHLNKQAVAESISFGHGRKSWLVFCNGVNHAFAVRDAYRAAGISCETITGDTPKEERDRILDDLRSFRLRAVTNFGVLTTGVDIPAVDMIVMLRHTMSSSLLLQMGGRGTRVVIDLSLYQTATERKAAISSSEKPDCLFLDFAGNIERHGFLDEIIAREKKKGDGVAPMKFCPSCASILHAAAMKCKDCGHEFPSLEKQGVGASYDGNVMSGASEWRTVQAVDYSIHNQNKEGKTPCLLVKYIHLDGSSTREYVCLQHQGFAKKKADKWWKDRDGCWIGEATIEQIIEAKAHETLRVPSKIEVVKEGKYDRVKSCSYEIEESAEAEHFDIAF